MLLSVWESFLIVIGTYWVLLTDCSRCFKCFRGCLYVSGSSISVALEINASNDERRKTFINKGDCHLFGSLIWVTANRL